MSSIPETILRMTHWAIEDVRLRNRLIIPEDIFTEICSFANQPIEQVAECFLTLVEYAFFEAHHEPQTHFISDRHFNLRVDPRLYLVSEFDRSIDMIERWTGIVAETTSGLKNVGGDKPTRGRTPVVNLVRAATRTGVYMRLNHSSFLGQRYLGRDTQITRGELHALANQFSRELKSARLTESFRSRVLSLYHADQHLFELVQARGGDIHASDVWQDVQRFAVR